MFVVYEIRLRYDFIFRISYNKVLKTQLKMNG